MCIRDRTHVALVVHTKARKSNPYAESIVGLNFAIAKAAAFDLAALHWFLALSNPAQRSN